MLTEQDTHAAGDAAELAILSAGLHYPATVIDAIGDTLRPGHFRQAAHGDLWRVLVELHRDGAPLTIPSVLDRLPSSRSLVFALPSNIDALPVSAAVDYHADLILDAAATRSAQAATTRAQQQLAQGIPAATVLHELAAVVESVAGSAGNRPGSRVDVAAVLAGGAPAAVVPTILRRNDGGCLFYAGQVQSIIGDPESGKTWLAYAAGVEVLDAGGVFVVLDVDHNGQDAIVGRLLALGARPEDLTDPDRFALFAPETTEDLEADLRAARAMGPDVVVLDSVGELMGMVGASSNDADEFRRVHATMLKPLAAAGAAVLTIDHLAKGEDSRRYGAGGTVAKKAAMGLIVRVTVREPFTRGRGGAASLTIVKDRHGGVRATCADSSGEAPCGVFTMTARPDGGSTFAVLTPTTGGMPDAVEWFAALTEPVTVADVAEYLARHAGDTMGDRYKKAAQRFVTRHGVEVTPARKGGANPAPATYLPPDKAPDTLV